MKRIFAGRGAMTAAALSACLLLTLIVHWGGLAAPFQFDDEGDIVGRAEIRRGAFDAMNSAPYRAVTYMTYAVDWRSGGGAPRALHGTNMLLHAAATGTLFLIIFVILSGCEWGTRLWGASAGALLFSVHPLSASNVTYISGRPGLLAALFCLLVVLLWLWRPVRWWFYGAVLLFVLALFSKEDAAALPIALPAVGHTRLALESRVDAAREGSGFSRSRPFYEAIPFFALAALYGLVRVFTHRVDLGNSGGVSWAGHALLGPYVWTKSLLLMLWPVGLSVEHDVPAIAGATDLRLWLPLAVLVSVTAILLYRGKWGSKATLAAIWFVAAMLPATVAPLADPVAENRLYFAFAGVAVAAGAAVGYGVSYGIKKGKRGLFVVICSALSIAMLSALSFREQRVWSSDVSLWSRAARVSPGKARPWDNLASGWHRRGDTRRASFAVRKSLEIEPDNAYAWNTRGLLQAQERNFVAAVNSYDRAISLAPALGKIRRNRAHALANMGKIERAEAGYRDALAIDPTDSETHYQLAYLLFITKRFEEAKLHAAEALRLNPADRMAADLLRKIP